MYMKKYFIYSAALLALVSSCQSDDFLGNTPGNVETNGNETAINFAGETGKITRADKKTGQEAATALGNSYVVYGYKTVGKNKTAVFDHYTITWDGKDKQTESNKQGWEYVGKTPNSLSGLGNGAEQTIKYWDYSATQYDFVAFSFGTATQGEGEGKVTATAVNTTSSPSYTLAGAISDLTKCFIADRITAKPNLATENKKANLLVGYKDDVQFNFRSLSTKVTMGIYETIPGYSVKNVKFYSADNTKATNNAPTLYATSEIIPADKGTITVTFPTENESNTDYNKAHVSFAVADGSKNSSSIPFGTLSMVEKEKNEKTGTEFIGRDITTFSTPKDGTNKKYEVVIPAKITGGLTLKVDYTLESIDGSGEEITVTGATAVVPEEYTNWQPNYAYTYIFKISDKTNGSTGTPNTDPAGLYPITFDAIVTETETGKQETITTVETRSITTYAKGAINNNEYKTGDNIYVSVSGTNGKSEELYTETTSVVEQTSKTSYTYHAKLYKLTTGETITEAEVPSIIKAENMTLGTKSLTTVGDYSTNKKDEHFVTQIAANDAVDGVAVTGNFFKFTPTKTTDAGTYVFAYKKGQTESYKVIKVAAN